MRIQIVVLTEKGKQNNEEHMPIIDPYHTERTEVSSSGFGRRPDSNIRNSYDHHSRLQVMFRL